MLQELKKFEKELTFLGLTVLALYLAYRKGRSDQFKDTIAFARMLPDKED